MPRLRLIQNSFLAGEWSPRMAGRTDMDRYEHAASELTNAIVMKQCGVRRRDGTRYVGTVHDSTRRVRLIPFTRDDSGDWVIELGHLTARFWNEGALWSPGGTPLVLTTPWSETEIWNVQYAQVDTISPPADVAGLYCVSAGTIPPCRFTYDLTITNRWALIAAPIINGPFFAMNTSATTLDPSATTGTITLVASAAVFVTGTTAGHAPSAGAFGVGALFAFSAGGVVQITAVASTTSATATVITTLISDVATANWYEGSWSNYRGWPRSVTTHQQRMVFGGSATQPNTIWGSKSGIVWDFNAGTALDSESYTFTLSGTRFIQWLRGGDDALRVGGINRVSQLQVSTGTVITADTPPDETVQSNFGAAAIRPVQAHNALLYLETGSKTLREVVYEFSTQSYVAADLSALAEHLTATYTIVEMAFQQAPDPILWCVRSDGVMIGMTYERPSEIVAWHKHNTYAGAHLFESVCRIRNAARVERVFMVVKRGTSRFIEYFDPDFNGRALNVDCAVTYTGAASSSMSGLTHLNGFTVDIVSSGGGIYVAHAQQVVASGAVTGLSPQVTVAEAGLHFGTTVATIRAEVRMQTGTLQQILKRIQKGIVRIYQTGPGCTVNGEPVEF